MTLQSRMFQSSGSWETLCEEVSAWVSANVKPARLASISMSEAGKNVFDTGGTIIVWYWEE